MKARIVAIDEIKSKKGNIYYRLWVVTENQPRPMRIVSFDKFNIGDYVILGVEPDFQCNAVVKVVGK